jgi:riboflavin kinase/FMN adenylyltransferase
LSVEFIRGLERYSKDSDGPVVATIGTFDGIHRGHQAILKRVQQISAATSARSHLITFHPHPRVVVTPGDAPLMLTTIEEKQRFIPDFFDGRVVILKFDNKLQEMSFQRFVKEVLVDKIGIKTLVVGYDHALGRNREGKISQLTNLGKEYTFEVEVVEPVLVGGRPVSSSRIRKAILADRYTEAIELLGHDYAIFGTVKRGIGLGRKLGYPTANLRYSERKLLPPEGVYTCRVLIGDDEKNGMMFIGQNHFNPEEGMSVEANLFDFDDDIYDQDITVYPTCFLRKNQRFESTDQLVHQLEIDKINAIDIMKKEKKNDSQQRAKSSDCC